MRILFVSANPSWTTRLDLLDELRELTQSLKGKHYDLELLPAAQPEDLREAVNGSDTPIDIVHFSGHATEKHGLFFRSGDGRKKMLKAADLNEIFKEKPVKLAFLNACHTKSTAEGFKGVANTVIGTTKKLREDAAKKMTKILYAELSHGKSIDDAFATATDLIEKSDLENVYMSGRASGADVPELTFASGDVKIDRENEDKWDRHFFERYLEEQIDAVTKSVRLNQRVFKGLVAFGVTMILFSWGHSIAIRTAVDPNLTELGLVGTDIANTFAYIGKAIFGWAIGAANETPLLDGLKKMGEGIPLLIASLQQRWCVHGNEKIRQLKALKELVENSETLSDTLRTRLHKILDQSVRAANYPPPDTEETPESAPARATT